MTFTKKNITPTKRVCFRLKEARKANNISLEKLAKKTRIQREFLEAIEECRFEDIDCAPVYVRGFIKKYVEALGMDPAPFLLQFQEEEYDELPIGFKEKEPLPFLYQFQNLPLLLRYVGVVLIVVLFVGYFGWQIRRILQPPSLAIYSPKHGLIVYDSVITVQGKSDPKTTVVINGATTPHDEQGAFQATLDMTPGVNTIIISATKNRGKVTSETRHVIYREPVDF